MVKRDDFGVRGADQLDMVFCTNHGPSIHKASRNTEQVEVMQGILTHIGHFKSIPFHSFLRVICHCKIQEHRNFNATTRHSLWHTICPVAIVWSILVFSTWLLAAVFHTKTSLLHEILIVNGISIAAAIVLSDDWLPSFSETFWFPLSLNPIFVLISLQIEWHLKMNLPIQISWVPPQLWANHWISQFFSVLVATLSFMTFCESYKLIKGSTIQLAEGQCNNQLATTKKASTGKKRCQEHIMAVAPLGCSKINKGIHHLFYQP